jgi:hypothetical protein
MPAIQRWESERASCAGPFLKLGVLPVTDNAFALKALPHHQPAVQFSNA